MFRKLLTACAATVWLVAFAGEARAVTTLKFATLAPAESAWGRNYRRYAKAVSDATNGDLQVDFQFNGQAGDENLVVQKIRAGQLDGGALTASGLAQTGVTDVLIFQLTGMFSNWAKLDMARDAVKDDLNKEFEGKGFTILGWGDVGAAKMMTVGYEVKRPSDLRGKPLAYLAGDPIGPKFFALVGGVTPKPITVSDILPGLTDGTITMLTASALSAEQLQWSSRITHVSSYTSAFQIGAFIVSSTRLQSLPPAERDVLLAKSREMSAAMTTSIRNLDAQAYARMKATKIVYDPDDAYRKEWTDLLLKMNSQLRGTVFSAAMFDRVLLIAAPQY
jgi:TRAP-type C4-dicarboxylate transport system substrate-binding protein